MDELKVLLEDVDVPEPRKIDLNWLARNLAIRNRRHHNTLKALKLVEQLAKDDPNFSSQLSLEHWIKVLEDEAGTK